MSLLRVANHTVNACACRLEPWPLALTLPPAIELTFEQDLEPAVDYLELDLASNAVMTLFGIDRQPAHITIGDARLELYPPSTFRRQQPPRLTPPAFPPSDQPAAGTLTLLLIDRRGNGLRLETADDDQRHYESGAAWAQLNTMGSGGIGILEDGLRVSAPHAQFSAMNAH